MPVAGMDIGAGTAKAVILENEEITGSAIIPVSGDINKAIEGVLAKALEKAGISRQDLEYVVATGWGRNAVTFADNTTTEIICHAGGVHYLIPQARTIVDIGAQDSKVIRVNDRGKVADFVMNDKCAAGTGRFLEVMAHVLGVELDEMGPMSLTSKNPCDISSTCTVFAETEVVSLRAQGKKVEDLLAGLHRSIANRVVIMGSGIRLEAETVFTGGVAKNTGVRKALEEAGGIKCIIPAEPQITGALGAALTAQAEAGGHKSRKG